MLSPLRKRREWPGPTKRYPLAMKLSAPTLLLSGTALLATAVGGCATRYIPNTDVVDDDDNRNIITFCEKYRHAVEDRNVPVLLGLASPAYYEDGGNVDASDDMDYDGLRDYLQGKYKDTRAIRYEIRYRKVGHGEKTNRIYVDYTYSASYKIPGVDGNEEWRHTVADNRLELVGDGKDYKIVAGM
jgi:hypothetical protein